MIEYENDYTLEPIDIEDGQLFFYRSFIERNESLDYFQKVLNSTLWEEKIIYIGTREVPIPRLTALYGDETKPYKYSGITQHPKQWSPILLDLKHKIEDCCGVKFTSVLLNLYRDGNDSVGWHSDNEPELGKNPVIASLSFGGTRTFQLKHNKTDQRINIELDSGDLLIMAGTTQQFWKHQIPKTQATVPARINLTFRIIEDNI